MKSFLEFLIEMSVTDAMKLFGINEVPSTKEELNKHFKKLALKHHPDLGGSEEKMKLLNQAKELLDKNLGKTYSSYKSSRFDKTNSEKDEIEREYQERMKHVLTLIKETLERFDANVYKDYLEEHFGINFNLKVTFPDPLENVGKKYGVKHTHNLKMEFSDKERDKVFELTFYIDDFEVHRQIYVVKTLDGGSDKTFNIGMNSFVFLDGKKQVLSKDTYRKVSDSKIFTDPSILLPKTKISKLAKGEIRKDSKLAKRDFEGLFKAKFNAAVDGKGQQTYYFIPVHNGEYIVCMYRVSTFKCYILHEIGKKPKSSWRRYDELVPSNKIPFASFKEDQEGMDFIKNALTELDKSGDYNKFIKEFQDFYAEISKKYK